MPWSITTCRPPTAPTASTIPSSALQIATLAENAREFGIEYYHERDRRQGIVHVVGPEQGFTLPGTTIVCGDSHTSTHGAFGALAHGIGTSEVEHVLATQTLIQQKAKNMRVRVDGTLPEGVTAKDIILAIIGEIGTAGGTGHVIEYAGEAIRALSMEGRMTICNMSIEGGARAGLIAPDAKTFDYIKGRPRAPKAGAFELAQARLGAALFRRGRAFRSRDRRLHAERAAADRHLGHEPRAGRLGLGPRSGAVRDRRRDQAASAAERSLDYMGLKGGEKITDITLDRVFIGSCTNGRIEDLREVAKVVEGRKVNEKVRAMIVPGSGLVKAQAEAEGLDQIFKDAGFEWREPGCSMCLGMNPDQLAPRERCASTSNRNFEGRQGRLGRTHLVSPQMAAAAAHRRPLRRYPQVPLNAGHAVPRTRAWGNARGVETACRRLGEEETPRTKPSGTCSSCRSCRPGPLYLPLPLCQSLSQSLVAVLVPVVGCLLPYQP